MKTESSSENFIRLLDSSDSAEYNHLIQDAFAKVAEFQAVQQTLIWTATDSHYYVLGLFKKKKLIAFLRLEWIDSVAEFNFKIDEDILPFQPIFPMGYLAKAGTAAAEKNHGFNSILRYYALKIFLNLKVSFF